VQWFKTMTTNAYIHGVKTLGWTAFHDRLWQRSYFEHVIRNEESLNPIRQYIIDNPARWEFDRENPNASALSPIPS
jgi:putative transposase